MPAALMQHDIDPKDVLKSAVGYIDDLEIFNNQILCAVYIPPEKTKGGIHLPDSVRQESKNQGKVGLVLKVGKHAFNDPENKWDWGTGIEINDWVVFRPSDGWQVTVNGRLCRVLDDIDIRGKVEHPDRVW